MKENHETNGTLIVVYSETGTEHKNEVKKLMVSLSSSGRRV